MRNLALLVLVSLTSSFFSILLYSYWFNEPRQVIWNDETSGEVRYAGFFDKLLNARSNAAAFGAAPTNFIESAQIATPAVVNIRALISSGNLWGNGSLTGSSGSGVIMSPDGYIITNFHVVELSSDIKVTLFDKREYKAEVIGTDPSTDLALLKIQESELPFMLFGNSDSVRVGEWVLAVGNPFNLESTVTAGIISAKGRNLNILGGGASIESFLQTDAAVNPGNSGGALVNTAGELIGINTAIITESGSYEGYSFAVPSNLVQKVIRDLKEFGEVKRAYLGLGIEDLNSNRARDVGLPTAEGIYVTRVSGGSSAAEAGLKSGDVIIGLNDIPMRHSPELQEYVGRYRPGDRLTVEYWRKGRKYRTQVTLKDGNNFSVTALNEAGSKEQASLLGLELRDLSGEEERELRLQGAMVTSILRGSIIDATNMKPGFVITRVNGQRVRDKAEALEAIANANRKINLDGYYEGESNLYAYRFEKPE